MKKLIIIFLVVVIAGISSAQTFVIDGEAKTGIFWQETINRMAEETDYSRIGDGVRLHSRDDAGGNDGRFRINMKYTDASGYLGFQARLNWEQFNNAPVNGPNWSYAYAWGSFFKDQFLLSLGKLGNSPYGSGGPEMWRELEITHFAGMRFEWKPNFFPGDLNLGLVINWIDDIADAGMDREPTIWDPLLESVFGLSYTNDWFHIRGAYRLDSELDQGAARSGLDIKKEGTKAVYRVEEYVLKNLAPKLNMSVWALGEFIGIASENPEICFRSRNWFFYQYAPGNLITQARFGLEATGLKKEGFIRPVISYKFINGLLEPRLEGTYAFDLSEEREWPDSKYLYYQLKPMLQVNFAPGAYVALEYFYEMRMSYPYPFPPEKQTQWINLRSGIRF